MDTKMSKKLLILLLIPLLFSCTVKMPPIPDHWTVKYKNQEFTGVFGRTIYPAHTIIIYDYWFMTDYMKDLVLKHELGHVYGVKWSKNPFCLMWEGESHKITRFTGDFIYEKFAIPLQAINGFKYCNPKLIKLLDEANG